MRIGVVMLKSSQGKRPQLDYCLIALENQPTAPGSNQINLVDSKYDENRQLLIRNPITGISDALTDTQIVVLLPMGPMNGVMIQGITRFRSTHSESFQKLHVLQLDGIISDGNSGAAVINRASGVLCGHIVMGCPGTGVAYMVPAWEVFADLQSRGINMSIPISHCENGEPDENFREHRQKNEISLTTKSPERATKASKPHEGLSGTSVNCSWEGHAWLKDMDGSLSQSDFWSHFFSLGRRGLSFRGA
ncbi:hypothetical protein K456DRAFT_415301 [Colletotrichum gloeosporioides 23]|nr:hypothetical protein K456DRAFT_415301 [Colletotrichum gloeosporioides 23]